MKKLLNLGVEAASIVRFLCRMLLEIRPHFRMLNQEPYFPEICCVMQKKL